MACVTGVAHVNFCLAAAIPVIMLQNMSRRRKT